MSSPPSARAEINRKTWDALGTLLKRLKAGEITEEQCKIAVDTLWQAVSGLADPDLMVFFSQIGSPPTNRQAVFRRGDQTVLVEGGTASPNQAISAMVRGRSKSVTTDYTTVVAKLAASGFTRIS